MIPAPPPHLATPARFASPRRATRLAARTATPPRSNYLRQHVTTAPNATSRDRLDKHDFRSWGEDWGEHGYIFLAYGSDMCSITYLPTYVDTEIADP